MSDDITRPQTCTAILEYLEPGDLVGSAVLLAADDLSAEIERFKCKACFEWQSHVYGCPGEVRT